MQKRMWFRRSLVVLLAIAVVPVAAAAPAAAAQATATWLGGTGNWNDPTKWSGGVVPNNGTPVGTTYAVVIDGGKPAASVVTLNQIATVDALTVNADDALTIANGQRLIVENSGAGTGTITNAGTIRLDSTGSITALFAEGVVTLSGGGSVLMSDNSSNHIRGNLDETLTNVDNIIRGAGQMGAGLTLVNQGTILADQPAGIDIDATGPLTNSGTMGASGGSRLLVEFTAVSNSGTVRADSTGGNATIQLDSASVTGGTVELVGAGAGQLTLDDGSVNATVVNNATGSIIATADDNTLGGTVTNASGGRIRVLDSATLQLTAGSTYTNNGTLSLESSGAATALHIAANPVTLGGTGTVELSNATTNHITGLGTARLVNAGNTIRGGGQIGMNTIGFTNQGTVIADQAAGLTIDTSATGGGNSGTMRAEPGATLTIVGTELANAGGLVRANGAGALVVFANNGRATGGTVDVVGAGEIRFTGGTVRSTLTNSATGLISIPPGTNGRIGTTLNNPPGGLVRIAENAALFLENGGGYHNAGMITMAATNLSSQLVVSSGTVTVDGGGRIEMTTNHHGNRIISNVADGRFINTDNTITGAGRLGLDVTSFRNQGTVEATMPLGILIDTNVNGFDNEGTVRAKGGSVVTINGTHVTNVDGLIEADSTGGNARVQLQAASSIDGGDVSLLGSGAGEVRLLSSTITNATVTNNATGTITSYSGPTRLSGAVTNAAGGRIVVRNGSGLTLDSSGTYTNEGTISLESTGSVTTLTLDQGDVTLSGGGTVQLSDSATNRIVSSSGNERLINVDNTIRGSGEIAGDIDLTNRGTIIADQVTPLVIDTRSVLVNQGAIVVAAGSELRTVGILRQLRGSITVDGLLSGTGPVDVRGGTIRGTGTITRRVVNGGRLAPGTSPGQLAITVDYAQAATGRLVMEINGRRREVRDLLEVQRSVTLDGTLALTLGYTPEVGSRITLIRNLGGDAVVGQFAGLDEGDTITVAGRVLQISYVGGTGNDVVLTDVTA
jgi:hypothetical protein